MKSKLKRAGWLFLAILFVATGLGIGVWGFWEFTHPPKDTNQEDNMAKIECTTNPGVTELTSTQAPLKGKQLPNFTPVKSVDRLQCVDIKVGSGPAASASSTVTANYTGAVAATGVVFESSLDSGQPISIPLAQVIPGWTQGIPGMQPGGSRRLMIPAQLAYGANPPPNSGIPANAALVFDITLISAQ